MLLLPISHQHFEERDGCRKEKKGWGSSGCPASSGQIIDAHIICQYANSDSSAEKAQQNDWNASAPKLPAAAKAIITRVEAVLNVQGAPSGSGGIGNKVQEFREDAKIWNCYLEVAELRAREQAELWNSSLDSLMIFVSFVRIAGRVHDIQATFQAGLFAGIIASFVIDARSDLQADSEQRILTAIREMLDKGSSNPPSPIPVATNWTSGLWILSLCTTLFSAIMGVLAKAWLGHFLPATAGRIGGSRAAYKRYNLDAEAERWHLREVLIVLPFLVQIAAFLFFVGLILQTQAENPTIGRVLLAFCISGATIYFSMTCIPLFFPSSPFNTTLSELCGKLLSRGNPGPPPYLEKDINECLGEILYTKVIKSDNPAHVDAAFQEVALPVFPNKWIDALCRQDTPEVLLLRMKQYIATRIDDIEEWDETICNYLFVFLKFARHYEKEIQNTSEKDLEEVQKQYLTLDAVLRTSLEPGNPLYRCNELPEALRPLLFGLRAQVIMLLNTKDLPKRTPLPGIPETPIDFNVNELPDRPWDMAFQDIRSTHRLHFVLGACRGLAGGPPCLKTISSFVLCLCLAKGKPSPTEPLLSRF
ncbi:hypothetical protein D9611_013351 [Ephemerocybe angulata]|uniref:DUF6535 domain-containing protein n=1 Tax=Ephemerocybe angulata TaxID=980116 RepID=A0A8H5CDW7_9AGAR|nr:hypothetical protein D9611_013351 [Tulosesus angulatus]